MPDTDSNTETASVTVRIPTPLRASAGGNASVDIPGRTVDEVLTHLVDTYPDLKNNLYTDDGTLRQFVNVYVDDEDIRYLDGVDSVVEDGADVSIVPSIAGG